MQVIKSDSASGDGVPIEREQPSAAFRSMPHFTDFGGTYLSVQPEKNSFGNSLRPIVEQQSNWDVICDMGTAVRTAAMITTL